MQEAAVGAVNTARPRSAAVAVGPRDTLLEVVTFIMVMVMAWQLLCYTNSRADQFNE